MVNAEQLFREYRTVTPETVEQGGVKTSLEVKFDTYTNRLTFRLNTTKEGEWDLSRFYHFNVKAGKLSFQDLVVVDF